MTTENTKRKDYTLSAGKCYQEELSLEQDGPISDIIMGLELDQFEGKSFKDIPVMALKEKLLDKRGLIKLLGAALLSADTNKMVGEDFARKIKNSELTEIIEDFFTFNKSLMEAFLLLGNKQDTTSTTPTS